MEDTLKSFITLIEQLRHVVFKDFAIAISDLEHYIWSVDSPNLNVHVTIGNPIREGSGMHKAISTKHAIAMNVDKSVHGTAYLVSSMPIKNSTGKIIGGISFAESMESYVALKDTTEGVMNAMLLLTKQFDNLEDKTKQIFEVNARLSETIDTTNERIQSTNKVINIIEGFSKQSNLLGLNAMIEASRIGEQGKGFQIVAEEIRKMALGSSEALKEIQNIIGRIREDQNNSKIEMDGMQNALNEADKITRDMCTTFEGFEKIVNSFESLKLEIEKRYLI